MLNNLIPNEMINENDRIALGISGGADSMLLLCALLEKQKEVNFYLQAIHINHHLRGEESDNDSKFVQEFCKSRNVNLIVIDVDVKKFKREQKKSLEEAARIVRYNSINDVMKKQKLNKLFVAHHANDQAETILMHIFRGAGISGASGIKFNDKVFRPFIGITKNQILEICDKENIKYVMDSSNLENNYTRNYIRNEVLPMIEKVYGDAIIRICEFGKKCNDIQNYIEGLVKPKLIVDQKNSILIKGDAFNSEGFIVREYVKNAFKKLDIFSDIESKHILLIMELNKMQVNSMLDLPHGITAKKVYEGVKFYKKSAKKHINSEHAFIVGTTTFEGFGDVKVEIISDTEVNYGDGNLYIDYYKISNNAVWRFRKPGDRFAKLGSGSKKLNDYFTDKKIEVDLRDNIPVLAKDNTIYLVAGYDISEIVKIGSETDKIVKITVIKN